MVLVIILSIAWGVILINQIKKKYQFDKIIELQLLIFDNLFLHKIDWEFKIE